MVCFCPFCGGNDIQDLTADCETEYNCNDCEKIFTVQIVRLDDDDCIEE